MSTDFWGEAPAPIPVPGGGVVHAPDRATTPAPKQTRRRLAKPSLRPLGRKTGGVMPPPEVEELADAPSGPPAAEPDVAEAPVVLEQPEPVAEPAPAAPAPARSRRLWGGRRKAADTEEAHGDATVPTDLEPSADDAVADEPAVAPVLAGAGDTAAFTTAQAVQAVFPEPLPAQPWTGPAEHDLEDDDFSLDAAPGWHALAGEPDDEPQVSDSEPERPDLDRDAHLPSPVRGRTGWAPSSLVLLAGSAAAFIVGAVGVAAALYLGGADAPTVAPLPVSVLELTAAIAAVGLVGLFAVPFAAGRAAQGEPLPLVVVAGLSSLAAAAVAAAPWLLTLPAPLDDVVLGVVVSGSGAVVAVTGVLTAVGQLTQRD